MSATDSSQPRKLSQLWCFRAKAFSPPLTSPISERIDGVPLHFSNELWSAKTLEAFLQGETKSSKHDQFCIRLACLTQPFCYIGLGSNDKEWHLMLCECPICGWQDDISKARSSWIAQCAKRRECPNGHVWHLHGADYDVCVMGDHAMRSSETTCALCKYSKYM